MEVFLIACLLILSSYSLEVRCSNADELTNYEEGDIMGYAKPLHKGKSTSSSDEVYWPRHTIPYEFGDEYPEDLREQFRYAANHIEKRTCFRFVPHTKEKDYVKVFRGRGCSSFVGHMGGVQNMSLPYKCKKIGTFVHEMMHAIGFKHEQSRMDRDQYVKILWQNIENDRFHNFAKHNDGASKGLPYDYHSVMHYSRNAFSKEGGGFDTIVPLKQIVSIGQRDGMSDGDIIELNRRFCQKS